MLRFAVIFTLMRGIATKRFAVTTTFRSRFSVKKVSVVLQPLFRMVGIRTEVAKATSESEEDVRFVIREKNLMGFAVFLAYF